jgi:hypothetical protein
MMFNIVTPHIVNGMYFFMQGVTRCCDRSCTCNARRTKKVIQSEYESANIGAEFLMEFRYSSILYIIWITFMYSSGLPILYFVAFLSFFATYWVDKLLLFRYYRMPPNYSMGLSNSSIQIMKMSIVLHFFFGFFMYSYAPILPSHDITNNIILEYTPDIAN